MPTNSSSIIQQNPALSNPASSEVVPRDDDSFSEDGQHFGGGFDFLLVEAVVVVVVEVTVVALSLKKKQSNEKPRALVFLDIFQCDIMN